jgi:integrase/recombinase XerD
MDEIKLHQFREKLELIGYAKRTIRDYPNQVELFLRYLEEKEDVHQVKDITPEHITAYHTWLQYTKQYKGKYLSVVTVRSHLGAIKTFYQIMHREHLVDDDHSLSITVPKRHKTLPRQVPTEQEMKILLESIHLTNPITTRDRAMLELLYATGMRSEELRTITTDNLDLTEKTVFITGKGSKDRVVPVGEWVVPYLAEYLCASRPKLLNLKNPVNTLFLSKNGRTITESNLCALLAKYAKKATTRYINPHGFRHACATHLLKAGADIRYVQELLGHADLSTTQIYTKIDISFLKQAHKKYHPRERQDNE